MKKAGINKDRSASLLHFDWWDARQRAAIRNSPGGPERRLWAAVIDEAVNAAHGLLPGVDKSRRPLEQSRALRWFASESQDIGSYLWVCWYLRLDPQQFRQKVRKR